MTSRLAYLIPLMKAFVFTFILLYFQLCFTPYRKENINTGRTIYMNTRMDQKIYIPKMKNTFFGFRWEPFKLFQKVIKEFIFVKFWKSK